MRNLAISVASLFMTTLVVGHAFLQKKQFYPSVIYITKSNPSMAVIYIQAFIIVILANTFLRKLFFGELRPVEMERLMERYWYAVTETCIAFTVFRDDFSPKFVALFTLLLFLKSFHWLAEERVDSMERSPVISVLFHIRIAALLILLTLLDWHFVIHAYSSTLTKGASVQLVFGFEYAILITILINVLIKYLLHSTDIHTGIPWENKAVFLLYTEVVMGFIKVVLYFLFVIIMMKIYTLPLFAFRPMYHTIRAFKRAFNDVILSRRAIRNMNTLYPDATPEELAAADNVCIICREEMHTASKKLPCNHIFHTSCLRSWFQRQQTCPTCRLNILRAPGQGPAPAQEQANRAQQAQQPPQPQAPPQTPRPVDNRNIHQHPFRWVPNIRPPGSEAGSATNGGPTPPPMPGMENLQFMCPPFPFMAFNVPPPMPPTGGLTDEELRRMESQTREGIEARIRCLHNIQRLLDTSMILMQQYCTSVSAGQTMDNLAEPSSSGNSSQTETTVQAEAPESSPKVACSTEGTSTLSEDDASQTPTESCRPPTNDEPSLDLEEPSRSDISLISSSEELLEGESDPVLNDQQEVIRQRRLEKFSSITPSQ